MALAERNIFLFITAVTLVVVLPVFVLTAWVVIRYRAGRARGPYQPKWGHSTGIDLGIWGTAGLAAVVIASTIWVTTHRWDPYEPVGPNADPPLTVQVIAEDWKWLFIYPKQDIAVVNQLVFPTDRPIRFKLTSDTVMNSFYIPGLSSQIYAMAGMQTKLFATADSPATYLGRNVHYSGKGFSQQRFRAKAVTPKTFHDWVREVRGAPRKLDAQAFAALRKPSTDVPVKYYASVAPNLFHRVIAS